MGRAVRRAEIPDYVLEGRCGCERRTVGISCQILDQIHDPPGCEERRLTGRCLCIRLYLPCKHILSRNPNLTLEKWAELLLAFDPDEYQEPPDPPAAAFAEDRETIVSLWIGRHAAGYGLRHPDDATSGHEDVKFGVQGRAGLKQDDTRTPRLNHLERELLEDLEAQVLPAYHLWPWTRSGRDYLPDAAQALAQIRDRQLWRETALTFTGYALATFGFMAQDLDVIFASVEAAAPQRRAA